MKIPFSLLVAFSLLPSTSLAADGSALRDTIVADYQNELGQLFLHFHRNPELSFREEKTAARLANELRRSGVTVTEHVGGTGIVGLMINGEGPLVLVRADMDGLPVKEDTGLDYASTVTQVDITGEEVPVMHACGHDTHMTSMVGTARLLAAIKDRWRGTVMFVGQPAEERIGGARAMLEDGLYERFGVPDYALAFHASAGSPAGKLLVQPGLIAASSDSVDITVYGIGAHGASPHRGKDPIYIASQLVIALQGIVSREVNPLQPAVVTVGSMHGGFKHNIIPAEVKLQLTVRAHNVETRDQLLDAIVRIAEGVGRTAGLPEDLLPKVDLSVESTPPTINDPQLTERVRDALVRALGEDAFYEKEPEGMGAEDFAYFVMTEHEVPGTYFSVGGTLQAEIDAEESGGPPLPSHHSPFFRIEPEPVIVSATEAMTLAVLELLPVD